MATRTPRRQTDLPLDPFDTSDIRSPEAERHAIAALLFALGDSRTAESAAKIAADVLPEMLADAMHRELISAIREAYSAPVRCPVEVSVAIRRNADSRGLDHEPAIRALAEITLTTDVGSDPVEAASRSVVHIREAFERKQAALALGDALSRVRDGSSTPQELRAVARRAEIVADIIERRESGNRGIASATGFVNVLDHWSRSTREPTITTMFQPIDRRLRGLPIGLTAIVAMPKAGKSALAGQLMLGAMLHDPELRVVWLRGEMSNDLLASKLLATWSALRDEPDLVCSVRDALERRPEAKRVAMDMATVIGDRLTTVDPPLTPDAIERSVAKYEPRLVVLDYLQLCRAPDTPDARSRVDEVLQRLAILSTQRELAIIVVSAMAGSRTKESSIGMLGKESNQLDYDAHTVVTLWKDPHDESTPSEVSFRIEASRTAASPTGEKLWFDGPSHFFRPEATEDDEFAAGPCEHLARFAPEATP